MIHNETNNKYYVTDKDGTNIFEVEIKLSVVRVEWDIYVNDKNISSVDLDSTALYEIAKCMELAVKRYSELQIMNTAS